MNLPTLIIASLIAIICIVIIAAEIRAKISGKCSCMGCTSSSAKGCSGCCSSCSGCNKQNIPAENKKKAQL